MLYNEETKKIIKEMIKEYGKKAMLQDLIDELKIRSNKTKTA